MDASDARTLCPPPGQRGLYNLLAYKQALVAHYGLTRGYELYRSEIEWHANDRLVRKPLRSLYEAAANAPVFWEVYSGGQPFESVPATVIGPSDRRPFRSVSRSFFVACLEDVRIRSRSAIVESGEGALVDFERDELQRFDDQFELDPAVFHGNNEELWIMNDADAAVLEIDEAFGSLIGPHSDAFGHWLWEYLPKYVGARVSGFLPRIPVLIDTGMPASHREALELLLPPGVEVIELPAFARARVRRLWCTPALAHIPFMERTNEKFTGFDHQCAPPHRFEPILREMRRCAEHRVPARSGRERVYLSRPDNLWRKLVNRQAIEDIAASRGFTIVDPAKHGFAEQVGLVRAADYVVGPEGSAMYLNFFARRGTKLCIMNHPSMEVVSTYSGILDEGGVRVSVLSGPAVRLNTNAGFPYFGFPQYADYRIDEADFASYLDQWLRNET